MPAVIKAGQSDAVVRALTRVDWTDHAREAAALIERAREEAAVILADARKQAITLREQAGTEGRAEGYARGLKDGELAGKETALAHAKAQFDERLANLASMFQAALAAMEHSKESLRLRAERDVLEFAALAASKLTFAIGRLHREAASENLRRSLALVTGKTDVTVRCNPVDSETLRIFAESASESMRQGRSIRLVDDATVGAGGCVLECGTGQVDASLETQVAEMTAVLLGSADA